MDRSTRMLWKRDNFWALEASPSNYEVDDARLGARRGGVAMCIQ